jgi:hypothetical protein
MYLALAAQLDTAVITVDDGFAHQLTEHPLLRPHLRRMQDFID